MLTLSGLVEIARVIFEGRTIWLLGEYHGRPYGLCDPCKTSENCYDAVYWVEGVINHNEYNKITTDVFIEAGYGIPTNEWRMNKESPNSSPAKRLFRILLDCIVMDKSECPYKYVRTHYIDPRIPNWIGHFDFGSIMMEVYVSLLTSIISDINHSYQLALIQIPSFVAAIASFITSRSIFASSFIRATTDITRKYIDGVRDVVNEIREFLRVYHSQWIDMIADTYLEYLEKVTKHISYPIGKKTYPGVHKVAIQLQKLKSKYPQHANVIMEYISNMPPPIWPRQPEIMTGFIRRVTTNALYALDDINLIPRSGEEVGEFAEAENGFSSSFMVDIYLMCRLLYYNDSSTAIVSTGSAHTEVYIEIFRLLGAEVTLFDKSDTMCATLS